MSTTGGTTPTTSTAATVPAEFAISSGNQANAAAQAVLPAAVGKTTFITGFEVTASGATVANVVPVTITGLLSTLTYVFVFPAGVTAQAQPLIVEFPRPIPAGGPNTAITVLLPAGGGGNGGASVVAHGFQQ